MCVSVHFDHCDLECNAPAVLFIHCLSLLADSLGASLPYISWFIGDVAFYIKTSSGNGFNHQLAK
jgi:hypothetical protein